MHIQELVSKILINEIDLKKKDNENLSFPVFNKFSNEIYYVFFMNVVSYKKESLAVSRISVVSIDDETKVIPNYEIQYDDELEYLGINQTLSNEGLSTKEFDELIQEVYQDLDKIKAYVFKDVHLMTDDEKSQVSRYYRNFLTVIQQNTLNLYLYLGYPFFKWIKEIISTFDTESELNIKDSKALEDKQEDKNKEKNVKTQI